MRCPLTMASSRSDDIEERAGVDSQFLVDGVFRSYLPNEIAQARGFRNDEERMEEGVEEN